MSNEDTEERDWPPVHPMFADWLRAVSLGIPGASIENRWHGIVDICDDYIDERKNQRFLVELALSGPGDNIDHNHWFRDVFKRHDPVFHMATGSNDAELQALAGAAIAAALDSDEISATTQLALSSGLVSAAMNGLRHFPEGPNLLASANQIIQKYGIKLRERCEPSLNNTNIKIDETRLAKIEAIVANQPQSIKDATQAVFDEIKAQRARVQTYLSSYINQCNAQSRIRDEELEILWWMFGEKSDIDGKYLSDVPEPRLPIILAVELAKRTSIHAELPTVRGLLKKLGLSAAEETGLKEAVEASQGAIDDIVASEHICPLTMPLCLALSFAATTVDWVTQWEESTGFNATITLSEIDLSVQVYRELVQHRHWN
ncbi:GTPase-associated system all-helical protein GASH [Spongiibacter marinus]|uniref:GTPase-associated system all-helical protein GASH n=1 Tax=Spongiibacter marinus TaxID=354246 RepID=UPI00195F2EA1|nr:GTPase-associated system all-helical protein GASH [Spongiibacter marinus]MBM7425044.1 hypothetical protein [Spongiibacter marinus]